MGDWIHLGCDCTAREGYSRMSSPKTCGRASEASERETEEGGEGKQKKALPTTRQSVENLGQVARSRARALTVVIASKTKGSTFASHSCQAFRANL